MTEIVASYSYEDDFSSPTSDFQTNNDSEENFSNENFNETNNDLENVISNNNIEAEHQQEEEDTEINNYNMDQFSEFTTTSSSEQEKTFIKKSQQQQQHSASATNKCHSHTLFKVNSYLESVTNDAPPRQQQRPSSSSGSGEQKQIRIVKKSKQPESALTQQKAKLLHSRLVGIDFAVQPIVEKLGQRILKARSEVINQQNKMLILRLANPLSNVVKNSDLRTLAMLQKEGVRVGVDGSATVAKVRVGKKWERKSLELTKEKKLYYAELAMTKKKVVKEAFEWEKYHKTGKLDYKRYEVLSKAKKVWTHADLQEREESYKNKKPTPRKSKPPTTTPTETKTTTFEENSYFDDDDDDFEQDPDDTIPTKNEEEEVPTTSQPEKETTTTATNPKPPNPTQTAPKSTLQQPHLLLQKEAQLLLQEEETQSQALESQTLQTLTLEFQTLKKTIDKETNPIKVLHYALFHAQGKGNQPQDYPLAKQYLQKALDLGATEALRQMALMVRNGQGEEASFGKAYEMFQTCYERGCVGAAVDIGDALLVGGGEVESNPELAFVWFLRAADEGGERGGMVRYVFFIFYFWRLAALYLEGVGVDQSLEKADEWIKRAKEGLVDEGEEKGLSFPFIKAGLRIVNETIDSNGDLEASEIFFKKAGEFGTQVDRANTADEVACKLKKIVDSEDDIMTQKEIESVSRMVLKYYEKALEERKKAGDSLSKQCKLQLDMADLYWRRLSNNAAAESIFENLAQQEYKYSYIPYGDYNLKNKKFIEALLNYDRAKDFGVSFAVEKHQQLSKEIEKMKNLKINVSIKMLNGKIFTLELGPGESVKELKMRIEIVEDIPIDSQFLVYGEMELMDEKLVCNYGIKDGSILYFTKAKKEDDV